MGQFSIRVRDARSGNERLLTSAFFSGFTSRAEAEEACAWYRESASGSARGILDAYVTEDVPIELMQMQSLERTLVPA